MSSWQVRDVSVPAYNDGSAGFAMNCSVFLESWFSCDVEAACVFDLDDFAEALWEPAMANRGRKTISPHSETLLRFIADSLSNALTRGLLCEKLFGMSQVGV